MILIISYAGNIAINTLSFFRIFKLHNAHFCIISHFLLTCSTKNDVKTSIMGEFIYMNPYRVQDFSQGWVYHHEPLSRTKPRLRVSSFPWTYQVQDLGQEWVHVHEWTPTEYKTPIKGEFISMNPYRVQDLDQEWVCFHEPVPSTRPRLRVSSSPSTPTKCKTSVKGEFVSMNSY